MFRKQLGIAMGVGEPLKHEELVRGYGGGSFSLVQEPWLSIRVDMDNILLSLQRAKRDLGQLAPVSLSKSIFLTISIDGH